MRKRTINYGGACARAPQRRGAATRARAAGSRLLLPLLLAPLLSLALGSEAAAQRGEISRERGVHTLYGDVRTEGAEAAGAKKPLSLDILLYNFNGNVVDRQTVPSNGRYRFMNLHNGYYDVVVQVENAEVARVRVFVNSIEKTDFRQDLTLELRADARGGRPQTVTAADSYTRTEANQSLFEKAQKAIDAKKYDQGLSLLGQLVAADPKDFQAWTELGTVHLMRNDVGEAEGAYRRAIEARPAFALALLNLGRVLVAQKKFDAAVEPLTKAVEAQPASADVNLLLGEAYLQVKKGSKAVVYLNEALRLDPQGKADAHLRLAALYNAAGMKDKAAAEYEQFLKKRPDHSDRKKMEQYIRENSKQ